MDKERMNYINEFKKKFYKRYTLEIKKDEYDLLKQEADRKGLPLNTFIKKALNAYTGQEIFKV